MRTLKTISNQSICIILLAVLCNICSAKIIYVDDDATGANDGSSWTDAYVYLQNALADTNESDKPVEIRVAAGIYKPDMGGGQTPGGREATFQLINGVTLAGGYAGAADPNTDPNSRNIELYESILSGDLNSNDVEVAGLFDLFVEPSRAENSYHVTIGAGTDETAILDGFIVTGGNDDHIINHTDPAGSPWVELLGYGAGMHNRAGSPALRNCTFSWNSASEKGGGMYNEDNSNPTLTNCIFIGNSALNGGGIHNKQSNPVLIDCTFSKNTAVVDGSGMANINNSNPTLTKCTFSGNSAKWGGGIYNLDNSNPTLTNCTFIGNWAKFGGGISNIRSSPTLYNCVFTGNWVKWDGGGIYNVNNTSQTNSTLILINCILWSNTPNQMNGNPNISYSDIQGGWEGVGNIDEDPLFASPGYWADVNNPNIVIEPDDQNAVWVDGDYHLKSQYGRWDPNNGNWVMDDVTSPCIDAGDPNSAIGDEPEPNGGRINMGVYGGTQQASKSDQTFYFK